MFQKRPTQLRKSLSHHSIKTLATKPLDFSHLLVVEPFLFQSRKIIKKSTPPKDKKIKGIKVVCRECKIKQEREESSSILAWIRMIGNRTKINEKFQKKMLSSLVENPEESINEIKNVVNALVQYRPDFTNKRMLKDLVNFLFSFYFTKSFQIFKIALAVCCSPVVLPFLTDDFEGKKEIILQVVKRVHSQTIMVCVEGYRNFKIWISTFLNDFFFILSSIKPMTGQRISEKIFTKFLQQSNLETLSKVAILVIHSAPDNFQAIKNRQANIIVSMEYFKDFESQ